MRRLPVLPAMPPMQCDDDCGACGCEHDDNPHGIPLPEADYQAIRRYVRERGIRADFDAAAPYRCPFYQQGRCAIYERRPAVCVAFGHVPELACPRGYNANLDDVNAAKVRPAIIARGKATRLLHELAAEQDPTRDVPLAEIWANLIGQAGAVALDEKPSEV